MTTKGPISRRRLLAGLALAAAAGAVTATAPGARASVDEVNRRIAEIAGDRPIQEGRVEIDAPEIAENGNIVPIAVSVDSPMTPEDHVKAIYVFADGNPRPDVCIFHFTPKNGECLAGTRIRLAKTQKLYALAEMSDGSLYLASREVKVTIGGCGG